MEEWIKKMLGGGGCVCIMKYYSAIKVNETLSLVAMWMDLDMIILSEVSQAGTDITRYHL